MQSASLEVYGDSYGVPTITDVVDLLVKKLEGFGTRKDGRDG